MPDIHFKSDNGHKSSQKQWTKAHILERLLISIDLFYAQDKYLLDAAASERSISHRLATHLTNTFPELDVDCEYNRDGFDVKKLALSEQKIEVSSENIEAVSVFPDIIVHRRGSHTENVLVIEMKKWETRKNNDFDKQKLEAFKIDLHYQFAVFLALGLDQNSGQELKCIDWI